MWVVGIFYLDKENYQNIIGAEAKTLKMRGKLRNGRTI